MDIKVKGKSKADGSIVCGYFCYHVFIYQEEDLIDAGFDIEDLHGAFRVPKVDNATINSTPGYNEYETFEYGLIRPAVQIMTDEETTSYVINSLNTAVPVTAAMPAFVEIIDGSAKLCTGMTDQDGNEIYEGDNILYQAGVGDYEKYKVIFKNGHFTTEPHWPWGCNYSPFASQRCQLLPPDPEPVEETPAEGEENTEETE